MKPNSANQKLLEKRPLFFSLGLVIALSLVITAFEWKTFDIDPRVSFEDEPRGFDEPPIIIPTYQPPPPKPKPIIKKKIEPVIVDKKITEAIDEIDPTIIINVSTDLISFDPPELPEPIVDHAPFVVVEKMPSFVGGEKALYKYLSENLKFPSSGGHVEGKVYVSFVVDKDGSISEVEVIKGIGPKFDEAARKVVENSPKWNAGHQRGVPVSVRMVLPITFKLTK